MLRRQQLRLLVVDEVVQVRARIEADGAVVERRVAVHEVLPVLAGLCRRVQLILHPPAIQDPDAFGHPRGLGIVPLLQLDQHRAGSPLVILSGDEGIDPLRAHREPELEEHTLVEETAEAQRGCELRERVPPGALLGGRGLKAVVAEKGALQRLRDPVLRRLFDEVTR
jgi:hypothetical protein